MLVAGEEINRAFGLKFGLSLYASAGLGNLVVRRAPKVQLHCQTNPLSPVCALKTFELLMVCLHNPSVFGFQCSFAPCIRVPASTVVSRFSSFYHPEKGDLRVKNVKGCLCQ